MENDQGTLIQDLSSPLYSAKGWMKLIGVFMIIYGVLIALSIIGIVIAWLPIWMGVLLFQAASNIEQANAGGDKAALYTSLAKLKTYFTIMGVLILITLILGIVGFIFGIGGAMMAGMQGGL